MKWAIGGIEAKVRIFCFLFIKPYMQRIHRFLFIFWLLPQIKIEPFSHFLYRFLDGKKTTRSQFNIPFEFHAQVQKCHFGNFLIFSCFRFLWISRRPGMLNWEQVVFLPSKNLYRKCELYKRQTHLPRIFTFNSSLECQVCSGLVS